MELQRITKHTKPVARKEKWHVVDAEGERLGRLATKVAGLLQGKHRPDYSRHQLSDDFVIVVNAAKVGVSGNKMSQKLYYRHSGYVGGMRTRTLEEMLARFPERVIELAVKGMLPRNRLGRRMLRRLKVYTAATHPHEAQVRIGMGKAKQAPAAPAPAPARRRRRPAREETAAEEEAAQAAVETAAVADAAGEVAVEAVEVEETAEAAAPEEATETVAADETEETPVDESADETPADAETEAEGGT